MKKTSSGRRAQTSWSQCTPSVPSTFAISWGSATTAVVPSGSTSRANSSTSSLRTYVGVDEAGHHPAAVGVEHLPAFVLAQAGDVPVADGDVRLEPLPREDRQHPPAANDEIGRLGTPGDGDTASQLLGHSPARSSGRTGTRRRSRPLAARRAETMAAVETTVGGSPRPYGASGSASSTSSIRTGGMSRAVGIR